MEKIIITIVLLVLSGVFKAVMDLSSEHRFREEFWNKNESWHLKWKTDNNFNLTGSGKHWWYFGLHRTRYDERFPYSSTILVFLTDGWHLFQFLFLSCLELAIAIQFDHWIWVFIIAKITLSGVFELVYSNIKKRL